MATKTQEEIFGEALQRFIGLLRQRFVSGETMLHYGRECRELMASVGVQELRSSIVRTLIDGGMLKPIMSHLDPTLFSGNWEVTSAVLAEVADETVDDSASVAAKMFLEQTKKPSVELSVDVPSQRATLRTAKDEKSFELPSEGVARWLKVLAEHPDQWIRPDDYKTHGGQHLDGVKPSDKLQSLKRKCPKLAKLIETSRHDGMRFNPALPVKSGRSLRHATN